MWLQVNLSSKGSYMVPQYGPLKGFPLFSPLYTLYKLRAHIYKMNLRAGRTTARGSQGGMRPVLSLMKSRWFRRSRSRNAGSFFFVRALGCRVEESGSSAGAPVPSLRDGHHQLRVGLTLLAEFISIRSKSSCRHFLLFREQPCTKHRAKRQMHAVGHDAALAA